MDLSFLKWPLAIVAVALVGWLMSGSGINYMYGRLTSDVPGTNVSKDEANEAGLSKLGGYCLALFQYDKARAIYKTAIERFPNGKNRLWNQYQMARCCEKMGLYRECVSLLRGLVSVSASDTDPRVANNDALKLRIEKLVEVNDLNR